MTDRRYTPEQIWELWNHPSVKGMLSARSGEPLGLSKDWPATGTRYRTLRADPLPDHISSLEREAVDHDMDQIIVTGGFWTAAQPLLVFLTQADAKPLAVQFLVATHPDAIALP